MKRVLASIILAAASISAHADAFSDRILSQDAQAVRTAQVQRASAAPMPQPEPVQQAWDREAAPATPAAAPTPVSEQEPTDPKEYVERLRARYMRDIHYDGQASMRAIRSFNMDCRARDGRVLPLENVMLATTASTHGFIQFYVQTAGGETRVVEAAKGASEGHVLLLINKWGELQSDKIEPMMNACYGTYGPIWRKS